MQPCRERLRDLQLCQRNRDVLQWMVDETREAGTMSLREVEEAPSHRVLNKVVSGRSVQPRQ